MHYQLYDKHKSSQRNGVSRIWYRVPGRYVSRILVNRKSPPDK